MAQQQRQSHTPTSDASMPYSSAMPTIDTAVPMDMDHGGGIGCDSGKQKRDAIHIHMHFYNDKQLSHQQQFDNLNGNKKVGCKGQKGHHHRAIDDVRSDKVERDATDPSCETAKSSPDKVGKDSRPAQDCEMADGFAELHSQLLGEIRARGKSDGDVKPLHVYLNNDASARLSLESLTDASSSSPSRHQRKRGFCCAAIKQPSEEEYLEKATKLAKAIIKWTMPTIVEVQESVKDLCPEQRDEAQSVGSIVSAEELIGSSLISIEDIPTQEEEDDLDTCISVYPKLYEDSLDDFETGEDSTACSYKSWKQKSIDSYANLHSLPSTISVDSSDDDDKNNVHLDFSDYYVNNSSFWQLPPDLICEAPASMTTFTTLDSVDRASMEWEIFDLDNGVRACKRVMPAKDARERTKSTFPSMERGHLFLTQQELRASLQSCALHSSNMDSFLTLFGRKFPGKSVQQMLDELFLDFRQMLCQIELAKREPSLAMMDAIKAADSDFAGADWGDGTEVEQKWKEEEDEEEEGGWGEEDGTNGWGQASQWSRDQH